MAQTSTAQEEGAKDGTLGQAGWSGEPAKDSGKSSHGWERPAMGATDVQEKRAGNVVTRVQRSWSRKMSSDELEQKPKGPEQ